MIKLGVDARCLTRELSGIGQYTLNMCMELEKCQDISLHLYCSSPILEQCRRLLSSANIREINTSNNQLFQLLWGETILPYWAKKDHVDVFWGPSHRIPRLLQSNCKRIVTIHDMVWKHAGETMRATSRALEKLQMPYAVKSADRVLVPSTSTKNDVLEEFNLSSDKIEIVYPAMNIQPDKVEDDAYDTLELSDLSNEYGLFVGTLEPRKNLLRMLEAYSLLSATQKNMCRIVIVGGNGWGKLNLDNKINELGLGKYVQLTGFIDNRALQLLYSKARFVIIPSLYEGFGLPIAEAMKFGVPVIAGNNSSMPEVLGKAGILVDAKDSYNISKAINSLIVDDNLHAELSSNSLHQISKFGAKKSADKFIGILKSLV